MKNRKYFLTSGEFAKMNGINKRTLHYYNDIGLFRPEMIDENGYHYYSRFQAVQLEMILIFRRLGLSIEGTFCSLRPSPGLTMSKIFP